MNIPLHEQGLTWSSTTSLLISGKQTENNELTGLNIENERKFNKDIKKTLYNSKQKKKLNTQETNN